MVTSVSRFDFAPIIGSETTDEGYLRVWCRAARTGVQVYRRADGTTVREYRPPEEVNKPESLATFGMKPVTWTHPPVLLDATNTDQYSKGHSGSQVRFNDGFVEVALQVTDNDSVAKINRRDAVEVSAGYRVDFDPTPGITPEGEPYDGVQRNIRCNHIAIVPRGRAGPEVRLLLDHMDAADAVAVDPEHAPSGESNPKPFTPVTRSMALVKLDGLQLELPTDVAGPVNNYILNTERERTQLRSDSESLKSRVSELEAALATAQTEKEEAEGRADALETELAELEEGRSDSSEEWDTARIDEALKQRLDSLQRLAPAFKDDFVFDGISEEELYAQAFENLTGKAPGEDADFGYIRGAVDGILLAHADAAGDEEDDEDDDDRSDAEDHTGTLRNALKGTTRADSAGSAQKRYRDKIKNGHTTDLKVSAK